MPIQWRPQMAVGNALIDGDHRYLIALINNVELALGSAARAPLVAALDQLAQYTLDHFEREEKLMRAMRYAGYERHRQSHRDLAQQLIGIRAAFETAGSGEAAAGGSEALIALLRSWLLDHVLKEDLLLKPELAGYPETFSG